MNFSVLMSLYNKEKPCYFDECLRSLYYQTLPPKEIVIVYDGFIADELQLVVTCWIDKLPISIVQISQNVGLGNALNEGLKHCNYEYVARMDTDDICHPERFNIQMEILSKNKSLSILGSSVIEFSDVIGDLNSLRKVPLTFDNIREMSKYKNPFNHMTVIFKKTDVLQVGGYKHHYLMEDYNLWLRMIAKNYQMQNIDKELVYMRVSNGSFYRRSGFQYFKSEFHLYKIKIELRLDTFFRGFCIFILRGIPRLLPISILRKIYKINRNHIIKS